MDIKGIDVILFDRVQTSTDDFGEPIYEEVETVVHDVLVGQPTSTDMPNILDLDGKKAAYQLCIPKGDTHTWKDRKVRFFGADWHTIGFPVEYIEENVPLRWNKQIKVEAYE